MRRIFLIGFMGCGKSSLGRRLAARLGWNFVDTDVEIERRAGTTIAEIFATDGEPAFRKMETEVLADICSGGPEVPLLAKERWAPRGDVGCPGIIVSLGGGAVCREGVMEQLNACGTTLYMQMPPWRLMRRLGPRARAKRPLIAGMNDEELRAFIEKTLPEREKWYKNANFVVNLAYIKDHQMVNVLTNYTQL